MKETLKNVDELYDKINQLLKSYDLLKKNNDKILEDLNSVKISLINKEDEIKRLKEKYDSLKFSNIIYNQSDKKLAKKKIRKMIDEIDNCILNLMG
jgi:uncharacterized coiled-coil DUF342 family protein|tara:strand:- start:270 stop:557 length:288 start_codon:yes stop_codon:yes gene_type:complete